MSNWHVTSNPGHFDPHEYPNQRAFERDTRYDVPKEREAKRWDRKNCTAYLCYCHDEYAPMEDCPTCGCRVEQAQPPGQASTDDAPPTIRSPE